MELEMMIEATARVLRSKVMPMVVGLASVLAPSLAHADPIDAIASTVQSSFTAERSEMTSNVRMGDAVQTINGVGVVAANIGTIGGGSNTTIRDSKLSTNVTMGNLTQRLNGVGVIRLNVGSISAQPVF